MPLWELLSPTKETHLVTHEQKNDIICKNSDWIGKDLSHSYNSVLDTQLLKTVTSQRRVIIQNPVKVTEK